MTAAHLGRRKQGPRMYAVACPHLFQDDSNAAFFMSSNGLHSQTDVLQPLGLTQVGRLHYNLTPAQLVEHAVCNGEGELADTGALAADTGAFTGRSPKDRFVVQDALTRDTVWWGDINIPLEPAHFDQLYEKMKAYFADKTVYVRDARAGADPKHQIHLRVLTETAYQNLFAHNLFLRPEKHEHADPQPDWTILAAPGFQADPQLDGTRQENFAIINFSKKMILIGGTGYTGEIKKGIFSVLNYILPQDHQVLSMHCSANVGEKNDTAIFFGLSGTGKTTLSADPNRKLIGDDEHGWTQDTVFNFEGGCYAKVIDLSAEKEPQIYNAIKFGALVENVRFHTGARSVDYTNTEVTENTRAAYPIHHIDNALEPSIGPVPSNIFFLTADAFGVLPPISKLTKEQAMYHFISGYTAKVAGTEAGIKDPVPAFSACFGAPFLPLHPTTYAEMLGEKIQNNEVNVWLINTGWTEGPFGVGHRISLKYTRAMITAALEGQLQGVAYETDPFFGLHMPTTCPGVPPEVLNPRNTWADAKAYDAKARELCGYFNENFKKYASYANAEIMSAAPQQVAG